MKFNLIGENEIHNPIDQIFRNRNFGKEDIGKFINPSSEDVIHWSKLKNVDRGIECILKHIEKGSKIFVQVDSDVDGLTSAAILINYINDSFEKVDIEWRLHEGKEHGLIYDTIPKDVNLVIVPDGGSDQYEIHKKLKEDGVDVLILDHHPCEHDSDFAILINNQISPRYDNKRFSGAGIVIKFCEGLDDKLGVERSSKYWDLVALGNIADIIDLRERETRYYCQRGLKNINNHFLKALIEKQSYSMEDKVNFITIGFYIAPLLNSVIRVGKQEDKIDTMKALIGVKEERYYEKKDTYESLSEYLVRRLTNLRAKQNRDVGKLFDHYNELIINNELNYNDVIIVEYDNEESSTLNGLVANQLRNKYKKPILILKNNNGTLSGSARGYDDSRSLKDYLLSTGLFNWCRGHDNALGVEIEEKNLSKFKKVNKVAIEKMQEDVKVVNVDFVLDINDLYIEPIYAIGKLEHNWSSHVKEPQILIKGVMIDKEELSFRGKRKGTLVLNRGDLSFIKKNISKNERQNLTQCESFVADLLCRFKVNKFNGSDQAQILIDKIIIKEFFLF